MPRVIGNKAINLKRRDPNYEFEEERVRSGKARNGIITGGIILGFVASVFSTIGNALSSKR